MCYRTIVRLFSSTCARRTKVCIVGSGPAGFYAAMHLTKHLPEVQVDILEKLPVPFGLIRYGVAPDHPEVKNVINQFSKLASQKNVNFYGNIALGKDVQLSQLQESYDAVLLTYGADKDKNFGIDNEDAENVVAARNFVGWYNGLPSCKDFKVDLSVSSAAILGQGNVALDVARILLSPIDDLRKTDITEYALNALSQSKVRELFLVGRRGPLQAAFTIKELREQLKLKNCTTIWREKDFEGAAEAVEKVARPRKRLTELMLKSLNEMKSTTDINMDTKLFKPIFFRSPEKFIVNEEKKVTGVQLICNKLIGESLESMKCVPTEEKEILQCGLAVRSIGYRSVDVTEELKLEPSGFISNIKGRVILTKPYDPPNLYVAGWLGTGPVGVILHTMGNAFQVAKTICEDLSSRNSERMKGGFEEVRKILQSNNVQVVEWNDWLKIDKNEVENGKSLGKPREKVVSIDEMLQIAS